VKEEKFLRYLPTQLIVVTMKVVACAEKKSACLRKDADYDFPAIQTSASIGSLKKTQLRNEITTITDGIARVLAFQNFRSDKPVL